MSTYKKIEKYERIKKLIILLTVGLVVIDTIAGFLLYPILFNLVTMAGVLT